MPYLSHGLPQSDRRVLYTEKTREHRQGKARQGKARQGKARQGKARQGKARQGKARQGKARQGKAMRDIAYITLIAIASLWSPLCCPRPASLCLALACLDCFLVFWFLPVFPGLTPCLTIWTAPHLDYCLCTWIISLPCPVGYCLPIEDPCLP